jgi:hypothetical protein
MDKKPLQALYEGAFYEIYIFRDKLLLLFLGKCDVTVHICGRPAGQNLNNDQSLWAKPNLFEVISGVETKISYFRDKFFSLSAKKAKKKFVAKIKPWLGP